MNVLNLGIKCGAMAIVANGCYDQTKNTALMQRLYVSWINPDLTDGYLKDGLFSTMRTGLVTGLAACSISGLAELLDRCSDLKNSLSDLKNSLTEIPSPSASKIKGNFHHLLNHANKASTRGCKIMFPVFATCNVINLALQVQMIQDFRTRFP